MLGGVKKANYFIAFEITLMQRSHDTSANYIMLTRVISLLSTLCTSDLCNNTLIAWYNYNMCMHMCNHVCVGVYVYMCVSVHVYMCGWACVQI